MGKQSQIVRLFCALALASTLLDQVNGFYIYSHFNINRHNNDENCIDGGKPGLGRVLRASNQKQFPLRESPLKKAEGKEETTVASTSASTTDSRELPTDATTGTVSTTTTVTTTTTELSSTAPPTTTATTTTEITTEKTTTVAPTTSTTTPTAITTTPTTSTTTPTTTTTTEVTTTTTPADHDVTTPCPTPVEPSYFSWKSFFTGILVSGILGIVCYLVWKFYFTRGYRFYQRM